MKRYLIYCIGMRKKGRGCKGFSCYGHYQHTQAPRRRGAGDLYPPLFFAKIQKILQMKAIFFGFSPPTFLRPPPSLFSTIRGARHLRFPMLTKRKSLPTFHTASYLFPVQDKASCRILSLERALRHRIGVFYARQGRHGN